MVRLQTRIVQTHLRVLKATSSLETALNEQPHAGVRQRGAGAVGHSDVVPVPRLEAEVERELVDGVLQQAPHVQAVSCIRALQHQASTAVHRPRVWPVPQSTQQTPFSKRSNEHSQQADACSTGRDHWPMLTLRASVGRQPTVATSSSGGSPFSAAETPRAALSPLVDRQSSVNSERPAVASSRSTSSTRSQVEKV